MKAFTASFLGLILCVNIFVAGVSFAQNTEPEASESKPDEQPLADEVEPAPEVETPAPVEEPLSEEIKQMQEVEPGFLPKDERATKIYLLQKLAQDNEKSIESKAEKIKSIRPMLRQKFRDDLANYTDSSISMLEKKYEGSINGLIKKYEIALKFNPENPVFTPDALYFLGNYYFEVDEREYFERLAEYNDAREQGREDVPYPEENFSRTIDTYEMLIERYPEHRHIDGVYYMLALAFWYEGAFYQAVDTFQSLIKNYPKSKFVEEVWFRLGEYFYDMDDYDDAIEAYSIVAKNKKSPLYDKALYKIAWAHYQKSRYPLAIKNFIKVLRLTEKDKDDEGGTGMRAEVFRFIIKSFSEQILEDEQYLSAPKKGDKKKEYAEELGVALTERVVKFFTKKGKTPPFYRELLLETASQLLDESKIDGAILALENVIKLNPKSQDNPRLYAQIVDILQEAGRMEEARVKHHQLIKRFGRNGRWYKSMADNIQAQRFAREAVRDSMLALAVYYHSTAKEQREAGDVLSATTNFKKAALLYSRYLREYPEREDTHKAIFYFAESAYELKRFKIALEAYQLLKEYPLPMPDNIRRDATFNIVFTFRFVLESEAKKNLFKEIDFDGLTSKSRGKEQEEIPEIGLKYLQSIDDFLKISPNDEQVPVLLFHAAAIYYVYGYSDEAYARFSFIVDTFPKTSAAVVAGRLIIDDAVSKEDWERVVAIAKRYKDQNLGGQKDDFARIEGTARFKIARAVFEQANELKKNNQLGEAKAKYKESAQLFQTLLKEDPKNPFADVMLFNAARAIVQSGTTTAALPLYRKLYTSYPKSEYAKTARFQEALALEKMLKFSDAAKAYDGIIRQDPKSEAAGDAMLNKALLYEAAGELNNAIQSFLAFAKKYPDRVEAPDALLTTASIYKKTGRTSKQIAILEQFIRQYKKDPQKTPAIIEANAQIAATYEDLSKSARSSVQRRRYEKLRLQYYKKVLALYKPELDSPIAAFYAAKAQLIIDKPSQDSFTKMRINARTGKKQGEQLTAMMKRLSDLSKKNEAVIKSYAQPVWNAESMRRIGALYEHLAASMIKAPCPRDVARLDEFACDEYTVLLEDKAAVLEDKALQAYKQAYEIAMGAYDTPADLVDNIQVALNRMRPGEYQRVGKVIEIPGEGEFSGQGRMLSNGKMAASLHPDEADPDIKKKIEEEPAAEPDEEKAEEEPEEEPEEELEEELEEGEEEDEDFEDEEEDFE